MGEARPELAGDIGRSLPKGSKTMVIAIVHLKSNLWKGYMH